MLDFLIHVFFRFALSLRYRIRVKGLDAIAARGTRGIVFFANHPGLIDPIIVFTTLFKPFRPRALADQDQIDRPLIRSLARRVGVVPLPDIRKHGPGAKAIVEQRMRECFDGLRGSDNLLLYPSGHIYRSRNEDLRGNSGVEQILKEVPEVRVVLLRTRGVWGSRFTFARGDFPHLGQVLRQCLFDILASFIFFVPKREVTLEFIEPTDFPRRADRAAMNAFIETWYNDHAPPALYVPRTIWERGGVREMPDPEPPRTQTATADIPASVRGLVTSHICEVAGVAAVQDSDRLSQDLGLDSLARAELALWIGKEFGHPISDVDAIQTVGDLMLAARGQAVVAKAVALKPVPPAWFAGRVRERLAAPSGRTLADAFLDAASRAPGQVIIADQVRGAMTYRDLVTAVLVLRPMFERLAGDRLGIMLPASAGASATYLATMFAGKTPVMVNWTTGARSLKYVLDASETRHVLTSKLLVERVKGQGLDLGEIADRFVYLEDLGAGVGKWTKLWAALGARLSWSSLRRAKVSEHAAILFTSGSEAMPKVVPLTHENILANIRDLLTTYGLFRDDGLMGFLPPFHVFGLTVTMLLPLTTGLRAVYHANPTEAWVIARLLEAYKPSIVLGTPTFLSGILRASSDAQLSSLRLAIVGAEKCPERTYQAFAQRCPGAKLIEGYGITECSPVVSAVREDDLRFGTIGRVMPSVEYAIVDAETGEALRRRDEAAHGEPQAGMLLVRGPNVFPGYLGNAPSPFVEHAGRQWYRTGDLVSEDADGVLTFRGRLKRFVKIGGEMISLPAIESALEPALSKPDDEAPAFAIEATPSEEHPEIVLFSTREIDRGGANRLIREAGLSALHNVTRVERVEALPLLGTGKTDYRALKERLKSA
ncbi:MAG: hypothetical protein AMXMBFR47_24890 [Planctomycetota bacterium]